MNRTRKQSGVVGVLAESRDSTRAIGGARRLPAEGREQDTGLECESVQCRGTSTNGSPFSMCVGRVRSKLPRTSRSWVSPCRTRSAPPSTTSLTASSRKFIGQGCPDPTRARRTRWLFVETRAGCGTEVAASVELPAAPNCPANLASDAASRMVHLALPVSEAALQRLRRSATYPPMDRE